MTLPPNLQAVRDTGVAWCTEKRFAALLDLIEDMSEELEAILMGGDPSLHARTALDEYRRFGE